MAEGAILGTFCEMPTEYDNFRQMRYDKIFYYYEREGGIYGENGSGDGGRFGIFET